MSEAILPRPQGLNSRGIDVSLLLARRAPRSRMTQTGDPDPSARPAAKGEPARGKVRGVVEAKLEGATSLGILFAAATRADGRFSASPASPERSSQGLLPNHMLMINRARPMPLATLAGMSGGYACPAARVDFVCSGLRRCAALDFGWSVIGSNHLTRVMPELHFAAWRSAAGFPEVVGAHADAIFERLGSRLHARTP